MKLEQIRTTIHLQNIYDEFSEKFNFLERDSPREHFGLKLSIGRVLRISFNPMKFSDIYYRKYSGRILKQDPLKF